MKSDFGLTSNMCCLVLRILFEGFSLLQSRYNGQPYGIDKSIEKELLSVTTL